MSNVSAAHVSATLAKAGYPRASEPNQTDSGYGESGFFVHVEPVENLGPTVIVSRQVYEHVDNYSDWAREAVRGIVEEALDGYTGTLRQSGYVVEDWRRYDGVRLGLFVTGREG